MEGVAAAVSAHLGAEAARLDALRAGAAGEAEFAAGAVELAAASADVRGALRAAMDQIASVQFAPHEHGCMCCGPFREREMGNLCFRRGNYVTPGGDSAVKHYTEALAQLPTEAASTGQEECRILLVRRAPAPAPAAGTPSGPGPPRGKPPPWACPQNRCLALVRASEEKGPAAAERRARLLRLAHQDACLAMRCAPDRAQRSKAFYRLVRGGRVRVG